MARRGTIKVIGPGGVRLIEYTQDGSGSWVIQKQDNMGRPLGAERIAGNYQAMVDIVGDTAAEAAEEMI